MEAMMWMFFRKRFGNRILFFGMVIVPAKSIVVRPGNKN